MRMISFYYYFFFIRNKSHANIKIPSRNKVLTVADFSTNR